MVCVFTFLAWHYIFLSQVCLVSWFTLYDNCTSAIVCLHLYVVICTVTIKSKARVGKLIWMGVILLIECKFSNRSLFLQFYFVLFRSANSEWIRIFGNYHENTRGLARQQKKKYCVVKLHCYFILKCNHQHHEQWALSVLFIW